MFVVRNYVTMGGTVVCALAIGYLMQNGSAAQPDGSQAGISVASAAGQPVGLAGLEQFALTSSSASTASLSAPEPLQRSLQPGQTGPEVTADCNLSARATAVPGAAARLIVKAPCHANQRIEVHHSGLAVSQQTDENGALDLTMPVLSEYAIFLISFDDQKGTVATTHVPDISQYDRVALQWKGTTDLQIHALEFGASYGGDGHVWADSSATGLGEVVHMGQPGLGTAQNIEIYSFPSGQSAQSGAIGLTVEADVTKANCGSDLSVQSLELRADRRLRSRDLVLNLPDCSQVGEFLVLNNLFQDLTIAAK